MAQIGVLIVDDLRLWRRFVLSKVGQDAGLHVDGEATDGLEAVRKAEALQPDLILLDIGLPKLNGLDAARQIRTLAPQSKILFLSQESDPDVVQEAMKFGVGFIVKTDAEKELLPAVNSVVLGGQFLSSSLNGKKTTSTDVGTAHRR